MFSFGFKVLIKVDVTDRQQYILLNQNMGGKNKWLASL